MKYLNAINLIDGVGSITLGKLITHFNDSKKIWEASYEELRRARISEKLALKIITQRHTINPVDELKKLQQANIKIIPITSKDYPQLLKEIPTAPYLLYVRGEINFNSTPMLAIVGSRKFSAYGKQVASSLARDLTQAGIVVVSGMALGIDTFAHQGALEDGGQTIAVLGSGLGDNTIGPRSNFSLSRNIINNGALISDYPLGTQANVFTFPARNRLMSGLTLGTIVIEAAQKSGTLITANLAVEFNREVFAVPGSIFSETSQGANSLIRSGAKIITGVQDVLEELNLEKIKHSASVKKIIPDSPEEESVLKNLSGEPIHIDRIIKLTRMKTSVASSTLAILEMKGVIKDMGGQNYIALL